jgi:hypothetical protein
VASAWDRCDSGVVVRLAAVLGLATVLALLPATATAGVINVPCSSENSAGVVQDAVTEANSSPGPDTISLAAGCTYRFSQSAFQAGGWFGNNALPPVASDITVEGNGATLTRDDTIFSSNLRFFFVGAEPTRPETLDYVTPGPGKLTIRDLTLKGGRARGGGSFGGGGGAGMGGAIFNMGTLRIERSTLTGNTALGGAGDGSFGSDTGGGGIAGVGNSGNGGGMGSLGGQFGADGGAGGTNVGGGGGGAGFRVGQSGSSPTPTLPGDGGGPDTGTGGMGGGELALGGDGAGSGGVLPGTTGQTGGGGDFGKGGTGFNSKAGGGGGVGGGGGQAAVPGAGGGGGFGGGGGPGVSAGGDGGFGGGAGDGPASPVATPGYGGGAADAATGVGHFLGGGGAGMGGAIFNLQGEVTVVNSTLAGNSAEGGAPQTLPNPAQGLGGAVFNLNGEFTAIGSTFDNSATSHGTSIYNLVYDKVETRAAQSTLRDTIVAHGVGGAPEDVVSERNNNVLAGSSADAAVGERNILLNFATATGGTVTGTPIGADPLLQPLADNGGPTQTMLPSNGSPALDAGSAFGLTTDQRGLCRPFDLTAVLNFGDATDIGAVEVGAQPCPKPPPPPPPAQAASFGRNTLITLSLAAKRIGRSGVVPVLVRNGNAFRVSGRLGAKRNRTRTKGKLFAVAPKARKTVKLKLPRNLRRLLIRKHRLSLRLSAVVEDPAGNQRSIAKSVKPRLKIRRRR